MEKEEVQRLAHGTSITFIGGVIGAGFTYLTGIAVARLVGSELVGVYYLSLIWIHLLSALSRFGFSDALLRFIPPERLKNRQQQCERIVKTTIVLASIFSVVLAGVLWLLVPPLGHLLGWDATLISYLRWFFAFLPLHVLFVLLCMVVQSYQRIPQVVFVRDIVQPASLCIFTILLLKSGIAVQFGLIGGFAASLILGIGVISPWAHKATPGAMKVPGWMAFGPLFIFALPNVASDVSHLLYRWVDTLMINQFLGLHDVGIYSAALRTSLLLSLITMAVNAIYATMASGYYHTDEPKKLEEVLQISLRWSFILAIPISLFFVLGAREILFLWGSEFAEGGPTLAMLAVAQLFGIPGGILGYTLVMCNRQTLEFINTIVLLGLIVAMNIILIPRLGLLGAAVSLLLVNTVGMAMRWWQVYDRVAAHPFRLKVIKPFANALVAGVVGFGAAFWLRPALGGGNMSILQITLFLAAMSVVLGMIYLLSFFITGLEKEDRIFTDMIRSTLRKSIGARDRV